MHESGGQERIFFDDVARVYVRAWLRPGSVLAFQPVNGGAVGAVCVPDATRLAHLDTEELARLNAIACVGLVRER